MQVTTLNKIINLFLIGTFVIFVTFAEAIVWSRGIDINQLQSLITLGSPVFVFITTLFSVSTIILLGIIVDALSNMSFRPLIKNVARSRRCMSFLLSRKYEREHQYLKGKFEKCFETVNRFEHLRDAKQYGRNFAVALFFHTANKENIEWVVQHYSIYLLATSYLFVVCLSLLSVPLIPMVGWGMKALIILVTLLSIYILSYEACRKYLYSYGVIYRHDVVVLSNERIGEKTYKSMRHLSLSRLNKHFKTPIFAHACLHPARH